MVPVDHVARVAVACAFNPPASPLPVAHVTSHPRLRFNEFLSTLKTYGYDVTKVDYIPWRIALETHVVEKSKDNALYSPPLPFLVQEITDMRKIPSIALCPRQPPFEHKSPRTRRLERCHRASVRQGVDRAGQLLRRWGERGADGHISGIPYWPWVLALAG